MDNFEVNHEWCVIDWYNIYIFILEIASKQFRTSSNKLGTVYETKEEGITDAGAIIFDELLLELKKYNVLEGLDTPDKVNINTVSFKWMR